MNRKSRRKTLSHVELENFLSDLQGVEGNSTNKCGDFAKINEHEVFLKPALIEDQTSLAYENGMVNLECENENPIPTDSLDDDLALTEDPNIQMIREFVHVSIIL